MRDAKHTPGPWIFQMLSPEESMMGEHGEWNISCNETDLLFGNTPYYPYVSGNIADAHLIAAAPELRALADLVLEIDDDGAGLWDAQQAARVAIAKAKGETT